MGIVRVWRISQASGGGFFECPPRCTRSKCDDLVKILPKRHSPMACGKPTLFCTDLIFKCCHLRLLGSTGPLGSPGDSRTKNYKKRKYIFSIEKLYVSKVFVFFNIQFDFHVLVGRTVWWLLDLIFGLLATFCVGGVPDLRGRLGVELP